jgi:hypothetical protein
MTRKSILLVAMLVVPGAWTLTPPTAAQSSAQRWEYLELRWENQKDGRPVVIGRGNVPVACRTTIGQRECRAFDERDTGAPTQSFLQHRVLATLGLEGWELVTVESGGSNVGWIFKRPTRP